MPAGERRPFREFGGWLRARRLALRWTQDELAERLRYDVTYLRKIEWGERKASAGFLARLAEVFELPVESLPPPEGGAARPRRLPSPPTSFVGRLDEVDAVADLLLGGNRLVTLVGAPGIGKTRVAIAVAAKLDERLAHGASFVSLVTVADAADVPAAVAAALDVRTNDPADVEGLLAQHLRADERLLVLDNFEHVVAAGPFVARLLAAGPALRVLVTSREALHVAGESQYPVPPLPVAPGDVAVALFVDRARAVRPDFALDDRNRDAVARICARLDGVPLAIELAAGSARLMSPDELVAALDRALDLPSIGPADTPTHQRSLRSTIEWSYRLLAADEQVLLARLGIFVGGFTLDATAAVCAGPGGATDRPAVVAGLASLVGKSLVETRPESAGRTRFLLLETIREFARGRLEESGEADELARRHATWALELAETAAPHLTASDQLHWLDIVAAEHPNLLAALAWADRRNPELGVRLAGALWRFWWMRGYVTEGRRWLERVLATAPHDNQWWIRAANGAGVLARTQGDYGRARALLAESAALARAEGRADELAFAVATLGMVQQNQGNYDDAERLLQESLSLYRSIGDQRGIGHVLSGLATIASYRGDVSAARTLLEQALAAFRATDDRWSIAAASANLGWVAYTAGETPLARSWYRHSLETWRDLADDHAAANTLGNLGHVAFREGDLTAATGFYEEALLLVHRLGERRQLAECLEGLAAVAAARGRRDRAVCLYATAAGLREAIGAPPWPGDRTAQRAAVDELRASLGRRAYDEAWAEGSRLTVDESVSLALRRA
jgi:predicted ATPase/transcriptional regulator with XRE-family HTH domain/Tfp pilus assembly protein PilF